MLIDDSTTKHFRRLAEVVDYSYQHQKNDREVHQMMVQHLLGEYYPTKEGSNGIETPVNLMSLAIRALSRNLYSKAPRLMAVEKNPGDRSWVQTAQISANQRMQNSNMGAIGAEVVRQSMVTFGCLFMGADYRGTAEGMKLDLVMESIDRADYVYDAESSTLEESDYQGHKFRMPLIDVRDHPWFNESKSEVQSSQGSRQQSDVTNFKSHLSSRRSDLYDYVDIWCIFDRRRRKVFYFPVHQSHLLLLEMEWNGPEHGPYRYLYYEKAPNHAVPISPAMHMLKKHRAFNTLDAKTIDQEHVAKGILAYSQASQRDAERLVNSYNNQSILQENGAVRFVHIGGANPSTVSMAEKQKADFGYQVGNLDQIAGLGTQSPTLGQERLLQGAANQMIEDMQGSAELFMKGVGEDIFWYDLRDPDPDPSREIRKPLGDTGETYTMPWTREDRMRVAEKKFDVDIVPYSYKSRSPESRLADLLGVVQLVMGMGDQATAQGVSLDVNEIVNIVEEYRDLPELKRLLIRNQNPQELLQSMSGGNQGGGSTPGVKRYERRSTSDGAGKEQALFQMMGQAQGNQGTETAVA